MFSPVISFADIPPLSSLPALAIDMGFSGDRPTCGIAFRAQGSREVARKRLQFGECVDFTSKTLASVSEAVLIVEAPLSAAFDRRGNPQARGAFEANPKPCWWSAGPGAAMALAAQYFLRALPGAGAGGQKCHLIEGFVTGVDSGDHAEVAERLIDGLSAPRQAEWHQPTGGRVVSILDWLDPSTAHAIPVVLRPVNR